MNAITFVTIFYGNPSYIQKQYVYNDGEVELDTGIILKKTYAIEISFQHFGNIIGAERLMGDANEYFRIMRNGTSAELYLGYKMGSGSWKNNTVTIDEKKHTLKWGKEKFIVLDDTTLYTSYASADSTTSLLLWHQNDRYGNFKIYSLKIFNEADSLILNLIPCLDPNGTACFYDTVTDKFIYPTAGKLKAD